MSKKSFSNGQLNTKNNLPKHMSLPQQLPTLPSSLQCYSNSSILYYQRLGNKILITKWKNINRIIIILRKEFPMPQHVRQLQSQCVHSGKRECHSLKYRQIAPNTPFYTIPALALPAKPKNRKQNDPQSDSFETCESDGPASSERTPPQHAKIKVELCKNFVEKGYCPYENRCRFAHGIQELRAKDTWGNCELYRTRKCKVFYEKHECKFGERCNFMHQNRKVKEIVANNGRAIREAIRINFQQIGLQVYASRVHSSKLMGLLRGERGESDSNI